MQTETITNMPDALAALGVTADTLTAEQKAQLDTAGYLVLPELITGDWLHELCAEYERLMQKNAAIQPHGREAGTRRLFDLENQGPLFDGVYILPSLLAAAWHVLSRDFRFVTLNGRDAEPGEGQQALHMDVACGPNGQANGVTCVVMLDAFTPDNGATRVVPGTHQKCVQPGRELADPAAPHPQEVLLTGPAGSVAVMSSHLWHGGTRNRIQGTRRALHPFYMAREQPQSPGHLRAQDYIRVKTYKRLSPAARYLLNVNWDDI